jgi:exopolyphosphatase/guanosine-5'-triphosphate,3'-diphosphate pyrophosphatase
MRHGTSSKEVLDMDTIRSSSALKVQRIAAIDIGTVTCRLLISDVEGTTIHELAHACAITNLGEGVDERGELQQAAIDRVERQIEQFVATIDTFRTPDHQIRIIAMATSAARDAANADDLAQALARHGVTLSVIPGEQEAALSFRGASAAFAGEHLLVADVGGGSTELIAGVGGSNPSYAHSFNVGCRRLTERFITVDPPCQDDFDAARAWFEPHFAQFFDNLRAHQYSIDRVVAVAGTATTVVSIDKAMRVYDASLVDGCEVSLSTLKSITQRLAALPLAQRRQVVGLQPDRAPVIVAGLVILQSILQLAGVKAYTVSESDILQGMTLKTAEEDR